MLVSLRCQPWPLLSPRSSEDALVVERHYCVFLPSPLDLHSTSSVPKGGSIGGLDLGPLWGLWGPAAPSLLPPPPALEVFQNPSSWASLKAGNWDGALRSSWKTQCCLSWARVWRIEAAMCPPVHPVLQMEPAAEAACASLLSEMPWPRRLCQLCAGIEWASVGQSEALPAQGRHAPYLWCAGHGPLRGWHLKAVLEEISGHCSY